MIKETIFNFISKNLSKVYLPKKIMVFKKFPLLPSRKVDINKIKNIEKMMKLYIDRLKKELCLPGSYYDKYDAFCVLICQDNNELFSFFRGNLKNQDTVNIHTKFNIGSISKTILSVMILKMVDMNLIKLDDKLVKYLYEFEMVDERCKDIAIRMLLNHSAGLFGCAALNYAGYSHVNNIKNANF